MSRTMKVNMFAGKGGEEYALRNPWPEDAFVQGGHNGVVFGRKREDHYRTAYFEVMPRGGGFLRGEGETLEAAEDDAWAKYERHNACDGHEFEPRGYRNGAGFCKKCGKFASNVFSGEDLGQFCHTCNVPTTYTWLDEWFFCYEHAPVKDPDERYWIDHPESLDPEEMKDALAELFQRLGSTDE